MIPARKKARPILTYQHIPYIPHIPHMKHNNSREGKTNGRREKPIFLTFKLKCGKL